MDWKHFFDSLGLNGTQWQWRVIRWQKRWDAYKADLWGKKQAVTYQHKFCPECGALMDRDDKTCAACGATGQSWKRQSVARALGFVLPSASFATPAIIVVNLAFFAVLLLQFGAEMFFRPTIEALVHMGALIPAVCLEGAWWQLITYGYQHGGLMHIAFNLFALSQVGTMLENEIGTPRFFSVYTLTLIAGGAADLLIRGGAFIVIVGASGALFGLIGFGVSYCHFSRGHLRDTYRNFFLKWCAYGFIFGFMIGADNIAHAGGMAAGLVLGVVVEWERRQGNRYNRLWRAFATLCLLATLAAVGWWLAVVTGRLPSPMPLG